MKKPKKPTPAQVRYVLRLHASAAYRMGQPIRVSRTDRKVATACVVAGLLLWDRPGSLRVTLSEAGRALAERLQALPPAELAKEVPLTKVQRELLETLVKKKHVSATHVSQDPMAMLVVLRLAVWARAFSAFDIALEIPQGDTRAEEFLAALPKRLPSTSELRKAGLIAALLAFAFCPTSGSARFAWGGVVVREADVLQQARACYGEAQTHLEACTAMAHVHRKRALLSGVSFATAIRYSRAVRNPPRHRRWVLLLHPGARQPAGWPSRQSWHYAQPRFRTVFEHVERLLRAPVVDPCPAALHYGGPMDSPARGFELDETCVFAGTRQRFFRRSTPREADPA